MRSEFDDGRRRLRNIVFTLVAIAIIGFGVNWYLGQRALERTGSRVISASKPFKIRRVASSYSAIVKVDSRAGSGRVVTTEKMWFHRPFESRIETWSGTKRLSYRLSVFGQLANINPSSEPLSIAVPPSLASGDLRVDAALSDAVKRHFIQKRERRIVYGRECQVYRAGGPVSAGDLTTLHKNATEWADFCVDRNGLVIEEYWVQDGKLLRRRVATRVHVGSINENLFRIAVPPTQGVDQGSITQVPPGKANQNFWTLSQAPRGYEHLGRFFVILPKGVSGSPSTGADQLPVSSITDVYISGSNLVIVDQSPALEAAAAAEQRATIPIHVRGLSNAVLILDARMNEVRGATADGSFVRVAGTIPASRLIELARSLQLLGG